MKPGNSAHVTLYPDGKIIKSLDLWHFIDGIWVNLTQEYTPDGQLAEMYIDGVLVKDWKDKASSGEEEF